MGKLRLGMGDIVVIGWSSCGGKGVYIVGRRGGEILVYIVS